jgi:predicted ATP-dependent protease
VNVSCLRFGALVPEGCLRANDPQEPPYAQKRAAPSGFSTGKVESVNADNSDPAGRRSRMAQRAARIKKQLSQARRISDQAQQKFLKAEDVLTELEQRELQRQQRVEGRR